MRYQRSAHRTRFIANTLLLLHRGGIDPGHDPMCKHAAAGCQHLSSRSLLPGLLTTSAAYYPDSRVRPRLGFNLPYCNIKVRARLIVCAHTSSAAQKNVVCAYALSATLLFFLQHNVIICTYARTAHARTRPDRDACITSHESQSHFYHR